MSIEAATQKIKSAFARVYSTVASGQSQVSVSLSQIRTIKVTLIGSRQPGNYSISSLTTVYNALFLGGGPEKNGSYRNIELLRNNKVYKTVNIYNFLVNGDQSDNVGLKDNDVIRIPAYNQRVIVEGEVKRSGIFEMKKHLIKHVILTGCVGSRLRPLSRKSQPKQYLAIFDGKSLFEMTVDRNRNIADVIMVVGNIDNCHLRKQVLEKSNTKYIKQLISIIF